jgi:hypothetical protein
MSVSRPSGTSPTPSLVAIRAGVDRVIQMPPPLCDMLPGRGLRRGSTVAVRGSTSMLLAMAAAATRAGCWCAVVGMPNLGLVAADELNVDLERLALVPTPVRIGPKWSQRCSTASILWWWRRRPQRPCRRVVCRHAPGNAGLYWWASVNVNSSGVGSLTGAAGCAGRAVRWRPARITVDWTAVRPRS